MMLSTIQYVSLVGSLLFIAIIINCVRKKLLKEAYALLWLLTGGLLVLVSVWTDLLRLISRRIGIVYPPATLFLLLIAGMLLILFQYSLLLSKNQERIMRLAQEVALLREKLERQHPDEEPKK